jgi:fructose-1,6-bisphosphatase
MKARTLFILMLTVSMCAATLAQEGEGDRRPDFEKFNAMRIAFITEHVGLTSAEAQDFWPLFNEYQGRKDEIRKQLFDIDRQFMDNAEDISEAESAELLEKQIQLKKKDIDLDLEYNEKFKEVLSAKKIMKLYLSERHFKSYLLRQIRNGQHRGGEGGRDGRDELPF